MRIPILEIAHQNHVHDQHSTSLPRDTNSIENTTAAARVLSMELVSLGRLVLVMHLTLIGYSIGYFQNRNPHGYPDNLI